MPTFLLLIFALACWGGLLQSWVMAAGLLGVVAVARWGPWRWVLDAGMFYRCADLSSLLTLLMVLYVFVIQPREQAIYVVLGGLPLLFAPLLLAQLFSSQQRVPLAALFYALRKKDTQQIDFVLPYAALTMASAGAANVQTSWYFVLCSIFVVAWLWTYRSRYQSRVLWGACLVVLFAVSFAGQLGLRQLQMIVEEQSVSLLAQWTSSPFKSTTSIGDIGELKLSDKIELRVKSDKPLLLHQASYDNYAGHNWLTSKQQFFSENPVSATGGLQQITIWQSLNAESVLALPDGTAKITGLDDAFLQYTELGAVKATLSPRFAQYQVYYTGQRSGQSGPLDLKVPKQHVDWLAPLVQQLQLTGRPAEEIAARLLGYFEQNYRYSLYLGKQPDADLALREFMLQRKAGHCEYFAAATVLLLRQAGVPARLANGYMVDEFDAKQGLYLVRSRHAHAWALAFINGSWQAVDTTPSRWLQIEAERSNAWQPFLDACSNAWFAFKQWQAPEPIKWLILALLPIYVVWRLFVGKHKAKRISQTNAPEPQMQNWPGLDSEFYQIELQLQQTPQARAQDETIGQWLLRLGQADLMALYQLHRQLRFDPQGISSSQRDVLRQKVAEWFKNQPKA